MRAQILARVRHHLAELLGADERTLLHGDKLQHWRLRTLTFDAVNLAKLIFQLKGDYPALTLGEKEITSSLTVGQFVELIAANLDPADVA